MHPLGLVWILTNPGIPAYEIVYYDYGNDETRKELIVWTLKENNRTSSCILCINAILYLMIRVVYRFNYSER